MSHAKTRFRLSELSQPAVALTALLFIQAVSCQATSVSSPPQPLPSRPPPSTPPTPPLSQPAAKGLIPGKFFNRIIIIVFENTAKSTALNQPYFSRLTKRADSIFLDNYSATYHPSQPNYIDMIAASNLGVTDDGNHDLPYTSIVDLLEATGISWRTYQENLPSICYTSSSYPYVRKHNPFISFTRISANATRCNNIVPSTQLASDISNNSVPQFVFYTPNMGCPNVPPHGNTANCNDTTKYGHASIVRTIEDNWSLISLGRSDLSVNSFYA